MIIGQSNGSPCRKARSCTASIAPPFALAPTGRRTWRARAAPPTRIGPQLSCVVPPPCHTTAGRDIVTDRGDGVGLASMKHFVDHGSDQHQPQRRSCCPSALVSRQSHETRNPLAHLQGGRGASPTATPQATPSAQHTTPMLHSGVKPSGRAQCPCNPAIVTACIGWC